MHVIFNADDFGLTPGINLGIIAANQVGVVRSTTLMVGMTAEKQAIELAKNTPSLHVGIHLRFTTGVPLTSASSLTDQNGSFFSCHQFRQKQHFSEQQITDEITAQIEYFLTTGIQLSHIDSHHHAHIHPQILPIVKDFARYYNVPLRESGYLNSTKNQAKYYFYSGFYGENATINTILNIINQHRNDTDILEIMCHPAYIDQLLLDSSSYALPRAKELEILTDEKFIMQLQEQDIILSDYSVLLD